MYSWGEKNIEITLKIKKRSVKKNKKKICA